LTVTSIFEGKIKVLFPISMTNMTDQRKALQHNKNSYVKSSATPMTNHDKSKKLPSQRRAAFK